MSMLQALSGSARYTLVFGVVTHTPPVPLGNSAQLMTDQSDEVFQNIDGAGDIHLTGR